MFVVPGLTIETRPWQKPGGQEKTNIGFKDFYKKAKN